MADVIPFAKPANDPDGPYLAGEALCVQCRHKWAAVAPTGVWQLECPSCGSMHGIWRNPLGGDVGDDYFVCNCGCEAMCAYKRDGLFHLKCMKCGTEQTNAIFGEAP